MKKSKEELDTWLDWTRSTCYEEELEDLVPVCWPISINAIVAQEHHPWYCETRVEMRWESDLAMLVGKHKAARLTSAEAKALAAKLRRAVACTAKGELIRESVFLELEGWEEFSVRTRRDSETFLLCYGDGEECHATIVELIELDAHQGERLASSLEAAAEAIENQLATEARGTPASNGSSEISNE